MSEPLISVIVPIYKVEEYLDRCIKSIVNQTYKNLEIILVDDGSPDNCPQMCDNWAEKDNRIKVIHKENGGLSDARNAGLKIAKGDYISFIDSDDWINLFFYEILLDTMLKEKSDIVQCEKQDCGEYSSDNNVYPSNINVETYNNKKALSFMISDNIFRQVVWNKLYTKKVISSYFKTGVYNEDEFWTYLIIGSSKKCTYISAKLYYYFKRENSIMGSAFSVKRLDGVKARVERHRYIELYYPELIRLSRLSVFASCFYHYQLSIRYLKSKERKNACSFLNQISKEFSPTFDDLKDFSLKNKMLFAIAKHSLFTASFIRFLLNKPL